MDSRKATISNAHTRTCHWLSSSPEYISWLDDTRLHDHNGFLWIKGKAGAGKSTLMKYALMQTNYSLDGTIVLSFFFNARGDHLEKSTIGAYRSLLHELLKKIPSLKKVFQALDPMPQHIEFSHYQWTLANLEHFLCKAIQQLLVEQKRVICFIDALDECDESDIRSMISFLQNLSTDQFRVCFASRPYPIITMRKCLDLDLDMQGGHRDDIIVYLQNQLNIGYSQEAESLRNMMQSMSSGIFLWVCLVVPMLNSAYDRGKSLRVLRRKLHEIPKDLHSLFLSIVQRDKEDKEQLLLVIQWVLFAARPLRPRELYYAMLHQLEPEDFEELMGATLGEHHSKSEYTYILAASKGLVQLTQSDDPVVQFIHESVKEFLINDGGLANIWPGPSGGIIGENHEQLKRSCLHYFLNFPPNHIQLAIRSLRQYAVENVLYHAEAAQSGGIDQEEFLRLFPIERFRNSDDEEEPAHALYILASRNYVNLIRALPSNSVSSGNFEMIDGTKWGSPFLLATAHGFQQVTRAFLEASVLNQNPDRILDFYKRCSGNDDGQWESHKDGSWLQSNPSLWLERLSNHQLAEALLEGRGIDYQSPLFAKNMALACILHDFAPRDIEVLLWSGKKESRGKGRWASLKYAIRQKATRVVRLLLSVQNMDVNERDESGFTSLMEAAEDDSDGEIIKILLKSEKIRVHVNLQNSLGRTALVIAAIHSSLEGFKALVALHNANINLQDKAGMTPLAMACIARDIGKMDLLLQRGEIDVNLPDWMGRAPLHWAITNEARTRLLLQTGRVIVEKRDFYGATLLWCAVARKNLAVVKLLLEMGQVDVNCRGRARVFNRPRGKTLIVYSPPGPKDPSAQVLTEAVTPLRMAMKSRMECPALFDLLVEYARQQGKKQLLRA